MTKAEYIDKYGVEAYEEHKRKCREYIQTHKKQITEHQKKYYQDNKNRILECQKEYYQTNKERLAEYKKEWYQTNKERLTEYYQANKERIDEQQKDYYSTPLGKANNLARTYKRSDRKRGFDPSNNVTSKWIIENIFSGQKCIYCGEDNWERLGCDRIDNNKPHTADNIVCSCGFCNKVRRDRYSVEEFKKRCDKN